MQFHKVVFNSAIIHEASFQRACTIRHCICMKVAEPFLAKLGGFYCEGAANGSIWFKCRFALFFFFGWQISSKDQKGGIKRKESTDSGSHIKQELDRLQLSPTMTLASRVFQVMKLPVC